MAVGKARAFEIIENGTVSDLKEVFEKGNLKPNLFDENGMTPLMQAAYKGKLGICQYLIKMGAKVNTTCHGHCYTALMMAALSGSPAVVSLLLENGAETETKNSIGKTAADLAAFTSQQDCLQLIKNFLSASKLKPYTTIQSGQTVARFPSHAVEDLRGLIMLSNPHPVNLLLYIKDHSKLMEDDNLGRAQNVVMDLCQACHRTPQDFDEILAIKLHHVSSVIKHLRLYLQAQKDGKIDKLIKKMLHVDGNGFPVAIESFIRTSMREFPFVELPMFREFVQTVSTTKIGSEPTALSCLDNLLNGLLITSKQLNKCEACGKSGSTLRCSVCKKAQYCAQRCQKLHWPSHKNFCKKA